MHVSQQVPAISLSNLASLFSVCYLLSLNTLTVISSDLQLLKHPNPDLTGNIVGHKSGVLIVFQQNAGN